jgi:hypothetical protein
MKSDQKLSAEGPYPYEVVESCYWLREGEILEWMDTLAGVGEQIPPGSGSEISGHSSTQLVRCSPALMPHKRLHVSPQMDYTRFSTNEPEVGA